MIEFVWKVFLWAFDSFCGIGDINGFGLKHAYVREALGN
jgi:hypothetical protein